MNIPFITPLKQKIAYNKYIQTSYNINNNPIGNNRPTNTTLASLQELCLNLVFGHLQTNLQKILELLHIPICPIQHYGKIQIQKDQD